MAEQGIVQKIKTASKNISKGDSIREEMELLVGPNSSWEDFLVPAPMCICLLGELMAISTIADFSLDKHPPKDGYTFMQWPHSFRASLTQVVNVGWEAFSEAHTDMDQIRLMSSNVPSHLKDVIQILLQGEDDEIEDLLPVPLLAIQDTADRCLDLATAVETKFGDVMSLTAEILAACVGAKGTYEQESKVVEIALAVANENKTTTKERKEKADKTYKDLEKKVSKNERDYQKAMDQVPGGWGMIGLSTVEGISNAFTTTLSGIGRIATLGLGTPASNVKSLAEKVVGSISSGKTSTKTAEPQVDDVTIDAYEKLSFLKPFVDGLITECICDDQLNPKLKEKIDTVIYYQQHFSNKLKELGMKEINLVKNRVIDICKEGIQICKQIQSHANDVRQDDAEQSSELAEKIIMFHQKVLGLQVEGSAFLGVCPTEMKAPNESVLPPVSDDSKSVAQQAVQNARFKIEQTSAQLDNTKDRYDHACDNLMESTTRLGEIMAEISKLDIQKVDFEKIRETLIKGIKALGELRQQWTKLVMFFQMMSNIIRCSLNTSLKSFKEYADKAGESRVKGYSITSLKKDMMYKQAFEAAKIAHLVNSISGSYVEVSKRYLMDRIAGLGKLQGYDPEKESHLIIRERQILNAGCREAQKGIKELILERKREFNMRVDSRIKVIKTELEKALPPSSAADESTKRSQETVKQAMKHVKETTIEGTKGLDPSDFE